MQHRMTTVNMKTVMRAIIQKYLAKLTKTKSIWKQPGILKIFHSKVYLFTEQGNLKKQKQFRPLFLPLSHNIKFLLL